MTDTDRELLTLAAKAAGFSIEYRENGNHFASHPISQIWSPLTDDGDALRLAVKLEMVVATDSTGCTISADGVPSVNEDGDDVLAATRRAIVRAAAEIGKDM